MLNLLSIPTTILRWVFMLCLWLISRPGGWAVACFIAVAVTWYIKP